MFRKNYYLIWGNNGPVKYQFSVYASGPWHSTMQDNDKYRRDSLDGGTTWGTPYQFRGADGRPGSDADVPQWVKDMPVTYIDDQWVISPHIYGGEITSETTINVGTDATIGNNLYLGNMNDTDKKMIKFNNGARISGGGNGVENSEIKLSAPHIKLSAAASSTGTVDVEAITLDLSKVQNIIWPNGQPTAVFA